jgi:hypothetical protein
VAEQRAHGESNDFANLVTPQEEVYPINESEIAQMIGIDRK